MTNSPRRKRFQIHLSTAVVMMIVTGALLWANLSSRQQPFSLASRTYTPEDIAKIIAKKREPAAVYEVSFKYGWPFDAFVLPPARSDLLNNSTHEPTTAVLDPMHHLVVSDTVILSVAPVPDRPSSIFEGTVQLKGALFDFGIAFVILFSVWFLCEWLISRSTARKGA